VGADRTRGEPSRVRDVLTNCERAGLDALVFPAFADVRSGGHGRPRSIGGSGLAQRRRGRKGNESTRHIGIPKVRVPMATMDDIGMPVVG
jgi:amidase